MLPIKADTTLIDYPATKDFKQVYGEAGNVPVTVLLLPDGSQEKLRGIFDKGELIRILNGLPEAQAVNGKEERVRKDNGEEEVHRDSIRRRPPSGSRRSCRS